jgi:hypothetical protein
MVPLLWLKRLTFVLVTLTAVETIAQDASKSTLTLVVDETQATRRIAFVHEDIPAQPGPLVLAHPRWIPGDHGAKGAHPAVRGGVFMRATARLRGTATPTISPRFMYRFRRTQTGSLWISIRYWKTRFPTTSY